MENGDDMQATKKLQFNLSPEISREAQYGHIYDDLKTGTLVSVGQISDNDFDTICLKTRCVYFKNGKLIIKGIRYHTNGLWNIPLASTSEPPSTTALQQHALGVVQNSKTRQDLSGYFHAIMFSPTPATFL